MTDTRPGDAAAPRPPKQEQEPASEEVTEVAPGVLRMQLPIWMPGLGHVNMYGLVDDRGLTVVDPGLPGPQSWKALKQRLKTAGYRVKDVHTVVVTHSHPDHFGGAGRIAQRSRRRADHAPRVLDVDGEGPEPAARALRRRGRAARAGRDRRGATRYDGPSPDELPDDRRRRRRRARRHRGDRAPRRARGARPRRGARRNHGPPLQAPRDDPRDAAAVHAARADRARAPRRAHPARRPRLVRGAHARATPSTTSASGTPRPARCSPATTCCPSITPHVVGRAPGRLAASRTSRRSISSPQLDGVKLGLPAHGHPFDRRPRPRRGDQGAPRRAHGEAARRVARARPGDRRRAVARGVPEAALGRRWPRARRSPTSSTSRTPAWPSAGTRTACSDLPRRAPRT